MEPCNKVIHCNKNQDADSMVGDVAFGLYYGECMGVCFRGLQSQGDQVYVFTGKMPGREPIDLGDKVADSTRAKFHETLALLPLDVGSAPDFLGCPDCTDGGGVYLRFSRAEGVKVIRMDTDVSKIPPSYRPFVTAVMRLRF